MCPFNKLPSQSLVPCFMNSAFYTTASKNAAWLEWTVNDRLQKTQKYELDKEAQAQEQWVVWVVSTARVNPFCFPVPKNVGFDLCIFSIPQRKQHSGSNRTFSPKQNPEDGTLLRSGSTNLEWIQWQWSACWRSLLLVQIDPLRPTWDLEFHLACSARLCSTGLFLRAVRKAKLATWIEGM